MNERRRVTKTERIRIRRAILDALLDTTDLDFAVEAIDSSEKVERWIAHGGRLPSCMQRELERDNR